MSRSVKPWREAVQLDPASTLLNMPAPRVPARSVEELVGSATRAATSPPGGPIPVHCAGEAERDPAAASVANAPRIRTGQRRRTRPNRLIFCSAGLGEGFF